MPKNVMSMGEMTAAGIGAGLGTGFAGMSAAAVISPMLITFLGMDPYMAVGDVYKRQGHATAHGQTSLLEHYRRLGGAAGCLFAADPRRAAGVVDALHLSLIHI